MRRMATLVGSSKSEAVKPFTKVQSIKLCLQSPGSVGHRSSIIGLGSQMQTPERVCMYVAGVLYVHTEKMGLRCGVGIREQWFASVGLNSANVRQFDSVCWQMWGSDRPVAVKELVPQAYARPSRMRTGSQRFPTPQRGGAQL